MFGAVNGKRKRKRNLKQKYRNMPFSITFLKLFFQTCLLNRTCVSHLLNRSRATRIGR
jgi:hypothetical protein